MEEYDLLFVLKQNKISFKRRDIIDINMPFQIDEPDSDEEIKDEIRKLENILRKRSPNTD